jgi:hypothetical protein
MLVDADVTYVTIRQRRGDFQARKECMSGRIGRRDQTMRPFK